MKSSTRTAEAPAPRARRVTRGDVQRTTHAAIEHARTRGLPGIRRAVDELVTSMHMRELGQHEAAAVGRCIGEVLRCVASIEGEIQLHYDAWNERATAGLCARAERSVS